MEFISKSTEDTKKFAEDFLNKVVFESGATVVALDGELGAGKTSFSQSVGEILGVKDTMQSPTFVIEKVYELNGERWKRLVHIDAYRLERDEELLNLGWEDIVRDPQNLVLIEWASRVKEIIPKNAYHIHLSHVSEDQNQRRIEIKEAQE